MPGYTLDTLLAEYHSILKKHGPETADGLLLHACNWDRARRETGDSCLEAGLLLVNHNSQTNKEFSSSSEGLNFLASCSNGWNGEGLINGTAHGFTFKPYDCEHANILVVGGDNPCDNNNPLIHFKDVPSKFHGDGYCPNAAGCSLQEATTILNLTRELSLQHQFELESQVYWVVTPDHILLSMEDDNELFAWDRASKKCLSPDEKKYTHFPLSLDQLKALSNRKLGNPLMPNTTTGEMLALAGLLLPRTTDRIYRQRITHDGMKVLCYPQPCSCERKSKNSDTRGFKKVYLPGTESCDASVLSLPWLTNFFSQSPTAKDLPQVEISKPDAGKDPKRHLLWRALSKFALSHLNPDEFSKECSKIRQSQLPGTMKLDPNEWQMLEQKFQNRPPQRNAIARLRRYTDPNYSTCTIL